MATTSLSILNPEPSRLSGPSLLHHLVSPPSQARALEHLSDYKKTWYSYQQLHSSADAIARLIADARQRAGDTNPELIIPVLIPQSPLLYTCLLGILKAGGTFCPLNIDAPPERIRFILEDVSATVAIVSSCLASKLPPESGVSCIELDQDQIPRESNHTHGDFEQREVTPDDLAYVMYTSGSTGTPKGVGISHLAATQALMAHERHIPVFERFLQFAAPTFDVSVFEIFFPLFRGKTLVSARRNQLLDNLPLVIREMDVDACELTPTVAGSLLRTRSITPCLKVLLTIGEMLNRPVVEEFGGSNARPSLLWAMYGPTEATIHCTLQAALPSDSGTGNIGTPLNTVSCFIIEPRRPDENSTNLKVLPWGEVGELAVGGRQLARGYLNRPEQTSAAFVSSPYGRLYRTGDRARLTPDGKIECLGRLVSGQVKLRGQRIELGEIEQVALNTTGCHGALAAVIESNLILFCAVDDGVTKSNILTHCRKWLPQFMVPGEVVVLPDFPTLSSGKVDAEALKASYREGVMVSLREADDEDNLAENDTVLRLLSSTLNMTVRKHMTLLSAGVDSLSAIKIASGLRRLGFVATATQLLEHKTIADLCSSLEQSDLDSSWLEDSEFSLMADLTQIQAQNPNVKLDEELIDDIIPCTPLQSAMLAETARNPLLYSNEVEFQVGPGFTPEEILNAIQKVAERNDILRTGFVSSPDGYVAVIYKKPCDQYAFSIVSDFQRGLKFINSTELTKPFRAQVRVDEGRRANGLFIQAHHAVYDGWSIDMILSDISTLLDCRDLPPRPQYSIISKRYLRAHKMDAFDPERKFWSQYLLGWNKTPFPKLAARPTLPNESRTTKRRLSISSLEVHRFVQDSEVSSQVLFQASACMMLGGLLGTQDVVIGSVTSGRTAPLDSVEDIIGPCIATLPLRTNLSGLKVYTDLLTHIHASNRAIMKHCGIPLSEVKKLISLRPTESLYDVLFVYQESIVNRIPTVTHFTEVKHLDRLETKLLLEVIPCGDGFTLQATYHSSALTPQMAECILGQMERISKMILGNRRGHIQSSAAFAIDEQSINADKMRFYQGTPDLAAQFQATVRETPSAPGLYFGGSLKAGITSGVTMSYWELNEAANQVARFLHSRGIQVGDVLAIAMHKSPLFYITVLGIIKAGCAYLPVLPATPEDRLRNIFAQARICHCLVDSAISTSFESKNFQIIRMNEVDLGTYLKEDLNIPADPSRLAYVIYTSGTTGIPKGVAVNQKNIVSNIAFLKSIYPISASARPRLLQACSQAFDVSVFEIFFAWHAGMCLCACGNDDLFEDLEGSIRHMQITHLSLTPTVASLISPPNVPDIEFLVTAGEPLTMSLLDQWNDLLWQGYGPSETTNICSVKRMKRGDHTEHLGWTLPNTSTFVLWPGSLETVPLGWVGEFCFGGEQVASGYYNEPGLTDKSFLEHPRFGRIYRSGDVGRMLPDGSLVIIGRLDDQIKLRGQRIEAGEINSTITRTGLANAAVTATMKCNDEVSQQLVSFYVPIHCSSPNLVPFEIDLETNRQLFADLSSRLPSYMVPSYLIPLDRIPMTSSGKVDRRNLQTRFASFDLGYLEAAATCAPSYRDEGSWTTREKVIAEAIAESTKTALTAIKRWTPFAALGIDSISAIGLSRILITKHGMKASISSILQNPTVAQLGRLLDAQDAVKDASDQASSDVHIAGFPDQIRATLACDPADIEDILPCTPLQEAMLSQGRRSYFNKILLRLQVQAKDMMSYWDQMCERHGILRTHFVTTKNARHPIAQVVLRQWRITWKEYIVKVPSLAGAVHEHLECLPEPLDSGTPPLSCAFIRYKGSTFLSLICHHALYDGVAMDNLWREIEALATGGALSSPICYKPFIQNVIRLPQDTKEFWAKELHDFKPSILFTRRTGAEINQCIHTTSLDSSLRETQRSLRDLGVSLLSACQVSWTQLLSVACDCQDITFGNVVNGRTIDIDGVERLVAPCFNTIPIRKKLTGPSQNIEVARSFQDLNARMLRYQFTSIRQIQRIVNSPRRTLFDTLLLLQQPLKEMDASVWTLEEDSGNMDIPLVCEVVPCPNLNSIVVNIHYDISLISGDLAATLADVFKHGFRRLLASPYETLQAKVNLPEVLKTGLSSLAPRRERLGETDLENKGDDWSEVERKIREVISDLSSVPEKRITRHTTIFQLGLDSINAVQIASALKKRGFSVSTSDVIEYADCAGLALRIARAHEEPNASERHGSTILEEFAQAVTEQVKNIVSLEGGKAEAVLPATEMQSAMLLSFMQSNGRQYLNFLTYSVAHDVEIRDLQLGFQALHQRHPMLRTGFVAVKHGLGSFAMIRYAPELHAASLDYIDGQESDNFELRTWKAQARASFLRDIHLPPWKVALVKHGNRASIHLAIHHALYDAQSLREIFQGLEVFIRDGTKPHFSSMEPSLVQVLSRSRDGQEAAAEFWTRHAEQTVVNKFPSMTPLRQESQSLITRETTLSIAFTTLCNAAGKCGVSIQAAVQAAWTRLLASYLGEDSVVFGVTLSGRTTEETDTAPFPCVTTVPVITSNSTSNKELLSRMMTYNAELHKHQFAPLSRIQKWLGHPASPVFDTLVVYQRRDSAQSSYLSLVADEASVEYTVSLEVEPADDCDVYLRLTFDEAVLPKEQASLLLRQFDATIQHLLFQSDGDEYDLHKLRPDIFSITPASTPVISTPVHLLHEFVEHRAQSNPDSTALEFVPGFFDAPSPKKWSYKELDVMGNKVANLLAKTISVGDIVAIHFPKCPEAYFSILGILKAGCAFLALDPCAPKARKEFILSDSGAKCLLMDDEGMLDFDAAIDLLRISDASLQHCSESAPELVGNPLIPDATCYCLYTSGTTGTPKGCEITHDNAVQAMMAFQELFKGHWDSASRWLQFAALHFDVSVLEQYWSWSVGITVVAAPRDVILDDLTYAINKLEITHIDLTPSLARLTHPDEVPSLCKGVFITGGEQLKQEILDKWGPKGVIYNAYGPTEATIGVTMYQRVPINGRPGNIGKQFSNVGSYVFHAGTEIPVLRGAVGELCISGKLVGKGYLNRSKLTEERFPTLADFGERIYRTGDLVRILYDGCFDFLGRADDQVKLRGQRLEIGEINHAIRTGAPEVQDVATIMMRPKSSGKDVLVSFIATQKSQSSMDLAMLHDSDGVGPNARIACLERLPPYMIPTYFLRVPYIPLSPNNKVEAKELRALFEGLSTEELISHSSAAMASLDSHLDKTMLSKITHVISDFSQVPAEKVSPSTSIFDLGVDSITALQLSSLLRNEGFQTASPAKLLKYPILADLVRALASGSTEDSLNLVREAKQHIQACHHRHLPLACRELSASPDDIEYIAPCTPLQQGIIVKALNEENQGAYFNCFELSIHADASIDEVRTAWAGLIDHHAVLRSVFVNTSDGHLQVALRHPRDIWRDVVVGDETDVTEVVSAETKRWVAANAHHIFAPIELVHVHGHGVSAIFIHLFHALYDGNSLQLMSDYASALYRGHSPTSGPSFFETLALGPLQRHDHCMHFWKNHLQNWRPVQLPYQKSPAGQAVTASRTMSSDRLEGLRSQHNVTLQSVALALWVFALQDRIASRVSIGIIVAGRSIDVPGVERTIGPLFNTLPFFIDMSKGYTWGSLIREIHAFNTSVMPFQHVPLNKIQKWCSGGRPIFDNLFAFQVEQSPCSVPSAPWTIDDGPTHPDYPLAFECTRTSNGELRLVLVAKSEYANHEMLEGMLNVVEQATEDARAEDSAIASHIRQEEATVSSNTGPESNEADEAPEFFIWTSNAAMIRNEIAAFAGVPVEHVKPSTTVLELGLDSIDAMKLSTRLRSKGLKIPSSHIMRHRTIPRMMQHIGDVVGQHPLGTERHGPLEQIQSRLFIQARSSGMDMESVESILPPTPLQEAMVAGMIESDYEWYFNHDVLEVADWVDEERLRDAWLSVIESSSILRTGFLEIEDATLDMAYCQVVFRSLTPRITAVSLSDSSELQRAMQDAKRTAFESSGLRHLVQLTFATVGKRRFILLSLAHALYDGWSLNLMYQDLAAAYRGQVRHRTSAEPFLSRMLASRTDDALSFWTGHLAGLRPSILGRLLTDEKRIHEERHRGELTSTNQTSDIAAFCRNKSISMQTLCAASWAMVVAEQVQALDVVFGMVLSGRDSDGDDALLFPTMNTVAMRCILHGSVSNFLQYLEETMADVRSYQALPLRKAQAAAKLSTLQIFNSLFLLQKSPVAEDSSTNMLRSVGGASAVEYPVCIELEPAHDRLRWRIACDSKCFSSRDTESLLEKADKVLRYILEHDAEEILSFHGKAVSICGLPATMIKDETPARDEREAANEKSDEWAWGETATAIRDILGDVSGVSADAIKLSSNLYQLGLDSISAIKVSMLLRKRGINLKPRDLVKTPNLKELARQADMNAQKMKTSTVGTAGPEWTLPADVGMDDLLDESALVPDSIEAVLPATSMQVYMLTAWQNSHGSVFFPDFCYKLGGTFDANRVYEAWQALVDETPVLRTRFIATQSRELPWIQVVTRAKDMRSRLESQPLIQLHITQDEASKALRLRLRIHHALYDGFSLPALVSRLGHLLEKETPLAMPDLSEWTRYCVAPYLPDAQSRRREFWTRYLQGCARKATPARPDVAISERISHFEPAAVGDTAQLRACASQHGIGLQALFLAAVATTLSRQHDQNRSDPILLGVYLANRAAAGHDASSLAAFPTLALAPIKVQTDNSGSLLAVARAVQCDIHAIASDAFAQVGLWELEAWAGVAVDCFVNFLAGVPDDTGHALTPVSQGAPDRSVGSHLDTAPGLLSEPWIRRNSVRDAFPPSVDIEATVQGSSLAVGVFGPRARISDVWAQRFVADTAELLHELGE
ncbi:hypothetical protein HIM_09578 [Hirsutella minnesotensis 3608]|uniref:Nonribosomal peptide synthetase 2 n=1 Tax=Hirsutella minnesotensis 3608 TaxID=1043627 RepID=A0A0F7ZGK5_9HYPO|nr:hypothetical protein HIM_09578 [Hirsutella minnesotensis 3608]